MNRYNFALPGPPIEAVWTVTAGLVTVSGAGGSVTVQAGSTWPGLAALPDEVQRTWQLDTVRRTTESTATQEGGSVSAGLGSVLGQFIRSGTLTERLKAFRLLHGTLDVNHVVLATAIDATREATTNALNKLRREEEH
jgi:hypothetical protein